MNQILTSTLSKYSTIILVGGGTGGHIQPIVSIVKTIREDKKGEAKFPNILWIGGANSQEQQAAKIESIEFASIPILKLATTKSFKILLYPFFLILGILRTRSIIKNLAKGENIGVFSKGGPGSVAVGLAAWSLDIPLYIHESDTIPGRSNRILGKFATKIWLGFESAKTYFNPKKCDVVGQILDPIFDSFHKKSDDSDKNQNFLLSAKVSTPLLQQEYIKWKTTKPHILVICGSQGSRVIFESIIEQFQMNPEYEWIIALGKLNSDIGSYFDKIPQCQAIAWISQENIAHLLQDTDIAITRGSATTLAEIDTFGIMKVIIPLPYSANNHQYYNALEYQKKGDIILEQKDRNTLYNTIKTIGQKKIINHQSDPS